MRLRKSLRYLSDAVWEYERKSGQFQIIHNCLLPQLEGQKIHPDELGKIYKEKYLIQQDHAVWDTYLSKEALDGFFRKKDELVLFDLRLQVSDWDLEWHRACLEVEDEEHLVVISSDIQSKMQNRAVGKAVETEFDYVAYISISDESYMLYHSDTKRNGAIPPVFSSSYRRAMWEHNERYVADGGGDALSRLMEIENVVEQLKDRSAYVLFCSIVDEKKEIHHKKIRFCYLDDRKDVLLLSGMDITDITREHEMRLEAEKNGRAASQELVYYLNHMPMGCCTIKIIEDENGQPCDLEYVYSNYAHSEIEGVAYGELIGKRFYEFFKDADPFWLSCCADTAYRGKVHTIDRYSPEIGKHLLIHTFQTQYGFCGCILQDITEKKLLSRALEENQRRMQSFLKSASDYIFQYDAGKEQLLLLMKKQPGKESLEASKGDGPLEKLSIGEILDGEGIRLFREMLVKLKEQRGEVSFTVRMRMEKGECERWYQAALFYFWDCESGENHIFGYLQDINDMMLRQEFLQKEAQRDPLTGIYNARTGREQIEARLSRDKNEGYNLMFMMDLDDFKAINDEKGHMAGDRALIQFSQTISRSFRRDDVYYRLGGDEFAAFISGVGDPKEMAEKIMSRFFEFLSSESCDGIRLKSSVGIFAGRKRTDFSYYYKMADEALYEAKRSGKNHYVLHMEE